MARLTPRHLGIIAVLLAASLPYLRTIPDYFVQDDFGGMQLLAAKPWHTFPRWFTMPWMEFIWGYTPDEIRPFTALSYQITAVWGPSAPEGHHLLNIVLHAANSLLVFAIARTAAGVTIAGATVAGVIFALLPVGAESVAWITGRVDSLPAFYYLLSFLTYARWRAGSGGILQAVRVVAHLVLSGALQQTEHDHDGCGNRGVRLDRAAPADPDLVGLVTALRALRGDDCRVPGAALRHPRRGSA